ncbi:hypothetical protein ACF5W4_17070 [Bacillota bacterium Lsc_1132]
MTWKVGSSTNAKVDRFGITIDHVILPNGEEKTYTKGFLNYEHI